MPLSGFGMGEMILIAMLVLIVFGPKRLPEITRTIGKGIREFKKGLNEIQRELEAADRESRWSAPKQTDPSIAAPGGPGAVGGVGAAVAGTATADSEEGAEDAPAAAADAPTGAEDEPTASIDPANTEGGRAADDEPDPPPPSASPSGEAHQEPPTPRPFVDPAQEFVDPWATDSSQPSMPRQPPATPETD